MHFRLIMIRIWNSNGRIRVKFLFSFIFILDRFSSFNKDLFADGTDFSSSTIEKNRNIYYQKQQANAIIDQTIEIMSLLTNALKIHLNLGQNSTMNTPSIFMTLETLSMESLSNKVIQSIGDAQIHLPENFQINLTEVSLRVRFENDFLRLFTFALAFDQ